MREGSGRWGGKGGVEGGQKNSEKWHVLTNLQNKMGHTVLCLCGPIGMGIGIGPIGTFPYLFFAIPFTSKNGLKYEACIHLKTHGSYLISRNWLGHSKFETNVGCRAPPYAVELDGPPQPSNLLAGSSSLRRAASRCPPPPGTARPPAIRTTRRQLGDQQLGDRELKCTGFRSYSVGPAFRAARCRARGGLLRRCHR